MADAQLEGLVQKMLDGGADDATIREAVSMYREKQAPRGRMSVSSVADPEGGLALANVAEQNPEAAVGGALAGMGVAGGMAGLAARHAPGALAPAAGRLLTAARPLVNQRRAGAALGGLHGYQRGAYIFGPGVLGGLEGAAEGATLGRILTRRH